MDRVTKANLRHLTLFLRRGRNPAARVYDSIGDEFFLAPASGWLNLGLWEGDGRAESALDAVQRLVRVLAEELPKDAVILDVGNGLGAQDPVIAAVARPKQLVALNITASQLIAGRERLAEAKAAPVNGDATRIPLAASSVDGVISVEAAFHFSSRAAFFQEVVRVLRPGGVLTMSDVSVERRPRTPSEVFAGLTNWRAWGLSRRNMCSGDEIEELARDAGLEDLIVQRVTAKVIDPGVVFLRAKLAASTDAPRLHRFGSRVLLRQWDVLTKNGVIEYLLIRARKPDA